MLPRLKARFQACLNPKGYLYRWLRAMCHPRQTVKSWRRQLTKSSIFFEEGELDGCSLLPEPLLSGVLQLFNPGSVLDVGCGTGRSLDYFLDKGVDVQGIEGSTLGISKARHPERILQWDLNRELNLNRRFDVVWCFEVAEHIHPNFVHSLVKTLINHGDILVISAAHPGQGGEGHFNEQPRGYWIELLAQYGFQHDNDGKAALDKLWTWFPENLFVFRRIKSTRSQHTLQESRPKIG